VDEIKITSLHPEFGARLEGIDNRRPLEAGEIEAVERAMATYAVVVLPGQSPDEADQVRFSRSFGGLELPRTGGYMDNYKSRVGPELFDAGNVDEQGDILPADAPLRQFSKGNELWHTDSSYNALPVKWSLLTAYQVPSCEGGETQFCDTRLAYDRLSASLKSRVEGLRVEHDLWHSREKAGRPTSAAERERQKPVIKPLVRQSENGRKALYLGGHAARIIGLPDDESRAVLDELMALATQEANVYTHKWTVGDLLIWDNRCTMHRVTPFDSFGHKRDLRRTTTLECLEDRDASSVANVTEVTHAEMMAGLKTPAVSA
jgi:alpha-ketoglutarate-dependent 2,4-dichlorophenoxyacetate dioxygenase